MRNRYAPICCIWWDERKLSWSAIHVNRAALRFLYVRVLKECGFDEEIQRQAARTVADCALSKEEITRILDATRNLKHWTILATGLALSVQEPPPTPDGIHQPASVVCECRMPFRDQASRFAHMFFGTTPLPGLCRVVDTN
ncbi:MAG: hypothetical protein WB676_30175 [Bryobacteraceae bacterium]